MEEAPPFQEAMRCDVCKCSFNAFRRRHHCRCCGRTLCNEHSSKQIPLPKFGIHSPVRVCNDCFNKSTHYSSSRTKTASDDIDVVISNDIDTTTSTFSRFDLKGDSVSDSKSQDNISVGGANNDSQAFECKCGMPLCICEAPSPPQVQAVVASTSNYQRPKKVSTVQHALSNANSKMSASSSGSSKPSERGIKRQRMDVHPSDISDDLKNSGRYSDDDYIKEVNSPRVSSRDEFEEQLRLVESEINALNDKKNELEIFLQEKSQEANRLATRNSQLESTLYKEQEDHKRLGSKIKKFIKAHLRFIRAKEDVKKTEARLQKLVDEFPSEESSRRINHGEESDVNVVSDGEPNRGSQIGLESDRNNAAIGIAKKDIDVEVMNIDDNESIQRRVSTHDRSRTTNFIQQHEMSHDKEKMSEEPGPINDLIPIPQESSDREEKLKANKCEDIPSTEKSVRDGSLSPISVPTEKVKGWDSGLRLPSTGMAAHAEDNIQAVDIDDKEEITDALHPQKWNLSTSTSLPSIGEPLNTAKTFLRNLPTLRSISSDHYNKYKGDDEEVDVEGLDSECKGIDLNF